MTHRNNTLTLSNLSKSNTSSNTINRSALLLAVLASLSSNAFAITKPDYLTVKTITPEQVKSERIDNVIKQGKEERQDNKDNKDHKGNENDELMPDQQSLQSDQDITGASFNDSHRFEITHGAFDRDNRYIYDPLSKNIISSSQVNSLYFPVAIASIYQPSNQRNINFKILNDQRTLNFSVKGGALSYQKVQFMVSFKNDHAPVSLTFYLSSEDGKVITIPSYITGATETKDTYGTLSAYDQLQINMTKAFLQFTDGGVISNVPNKKGKEYWVLDEHIDHPYSPDHRFTLSNYNQYSSTQYVMRTWTICAKTDVLYLQPSDFYQSKSHISAITLTKDTFAHQGECGGLMILLQKEKSPPFDDEDTQSFSPVTGEGV